MFEVGVCNLLVMTDGGGSQEIWTKVPLKIQTDVFGIWQLLSEGMVGGPLIEIHTDLWIILELLEQSAPHGLTEIRDLRGFGAPGRKGTLHFSG